MKLDEIHSNWALDTKIKKESLEEESLRIPELHSKYLNFLSTERKVYKALIERKKLLEETLTDYFLGRIDGKDIGREPWQGTESKSSAEKRVERDAAIINLNLQISEQEEKVLALKEIISNINQRTWHIKNAIDFIKWTGGAGL